MRCLGNDSTQDIARKPKDIKSPESERTDLMGLDSQEIVFMLCHK